MSPSNVLRKDANRECIQYRVEGVASMVSTMSVDFLNLTSRLDWNLVATLFRGDTDEKYRIWVSARYHTLRNDDLRPPTLSSMNSSSRRGKDACQSSKTR